MLQRIKFSGRVIRSVRLSNSGNSIMFTRATQAFGKLVDDIRHFGVGGVQTHGARIAAESDRGASRQFSLAQQKRQRAVLLPRGVMHCR